MKRFILGVIAYFIFAGSAFAAAPEVMTYQGRLKENGLPVTGNRDITISLCDAPTAGTCYSSPLQSVYVSTGLFKSTFTLPSGVDLSAYEWYLQVNVNTVDLLPREKFTSVPYAILASSSVHASTASYAGALAVVSGAGVYSSTHVIISGGLVASDWYVGASTVAAIEGSVLVQDLSAAVQDIRAGVVGRARSGSTDSVDAAVGASFEAEIPAGMSGIPLALRASVRNEGAATPQAMILMIDALENTGVLGSTYGLYIATMTAGVQSVAPYALYSEDPNARAYFAGNVGISSAAPAYALSVSSGAGESGTIMAVSTGATNLFWVAGDGAHATRFFGDGSGLTGVTGATGNDPDALQLAGGTMQGAIDMDGFALNGVSTITIYAQSLAIVPPGTGGSNIGYGISIGSNTYDNYTGGLGVGHGAYDNYTGGVGLGKSARSNYGYGIGVGNSAFNNYSFGVGIGNGASNNYSYGVGLGASAGSNYSYGVGVGYQANFNNDYAVGVGAYSQNNAGYGAALGAYSYASSSSTALGAQAKANAELSMALGYGTVNNSTGTASFGVYNVDAPAYWINGSTVVVLFGTSSMAVGPMAGSQAAGNYNLFVGSAAGKAVTGSFNTMIGYGAGFNSVATERNTFIGMSAGSANVTGGNNIVIGESQNTSATNANFELNIGGLLFGKLNDKVVGISTRAPQAALDIVSTGTLNTQMAQVWRDSTGLIVGSMSVTGSMQAVRFVGDGSGLSGVTASGAVQKTGDNMTGTLDMGGNFIAGVSTITMQAGSIAIVPPGTAGSNAGYGISIGSNAYNNYSNGVGVGYGANENRADGVGVGYNAKSNQFGGVGIGYGARSNYTVGVGAGYNAYDNYNYGVGVGGYADSNYNYGVGVGAYAKSNNDYAVGIGAYSQNNAGYGAALGAYSYASSSATALGAQAKANAELSMALGYGTVNNSTGTASFGSYGIHTSTAVNAAYYQIDGSTVIAVLPSASSIGVGPLAGESNTSGAYNVFVGRGAGSSNTTTSNNTMVGYAAGTLNTGSANTFLGSYAGNSSTTGGSNIVIGYLQEPSAPDANNELNVGGVLFGQLGFKTIGISTRVPQAALDIVSTGTVHTDMAQLWRDSTGLIVGSMSVTGSMQAVRFVGDGSGLSGVTASGNVLTTGDTMTGDLFMAGSSTITVSGSAFSVGGSTFAVANGRVGIGTSSPARALDVQLPSGTSADGIRVTAGSSIRLDLASDHTDGSARNWALFSNSPRFGDFRVRRSNSKGGDPYISGNSMLYLAREGNVGFTDDLPLYRLHISSGAGETGIVMAVSTGTSNLFWVDGYGAHATSFFGDGAGLTGVTAAGAVQKTGDSMTGTLDMGGNLIVGVSTITMQGGSIAIVPPDTAGSNNEYGISIGSNSYNNYTFAVGVGHGTYENYSEGVGVGHLANSNYAAGVGIGYGASNNHTYGVGIGANAANNYDYATGVGAFASSRSSSAAFGYYAKALNNEALALGAGAKANAFKSIAIGAYTVNDSTGTASFGAYAVHTSSAMNAARYQINGSTVLVVLPGTGSLGVGPSAGKLNTGSYSSFLGTFAGNLNTTGTKNTFLGSNSGTANNTAGFNTFVGAYAGHLNTGGNNSFVGAHSGHNNSSGGSNTFLGSNSGVNTESGSANTIVGNAAGYGIAGNSFSSGTIVGAQAGYKLSSGANDNTFLGWRAGYDVTTGTGNIVIGYDEDTSAAGASNELNVGGVLFGRLDERAIGISTRAPQAALDVVSTATASNVYAQIWRDSSGVIVASITSQGKFATALAMPGDDLGNHIAAQPLYMGSYAVNSSSAISAAYYQVNGSTVLAMQAGGSLLAGLSAGPVNSGANNAFFGGYAGYSNTSGASNVFLGSSAGRSNTTANYNTFVGNIAGYNNTTGAGNSFLGYSSGQFNTTGESNTFIGSTAGLMNKTGSANVVLGRDAGRGVINTFISSSTLIGYNAGYALQNSTGNILIGFRAGDTITSGGNNILIGNDVDLPDPLGSNALNIGNLILGDMSSGYAAINGNLSASTITVQGNAFSVGASTFVVKEGRVGINWTTPEAELQVSGTTKLLAKASTAYILTAGTFTQPDLFIISTHGVVSVGEFASTELSTDTLVNLTPVLRSGADIAVGMDVFGYSDPVASVSAIGEESGLIGASFEVEAGGDDFMTHLVGLRSQLRREGGGAGLVDHAAAIWIDRMYSGGGGTMINTYGLHISTLTVPNQTNAPYAIYSEDANARTYFAGNVGISSTTPAYALVVSSGTGNVLWVSSYAVHGMNFVGDGSGLQNVTASGAVQKIGDVMTGPLTINSPMGAQSSDLVTNGIVISTGGAIQTTGLGHGTVAGNARGVGAVDLQTRRDNVAQVASGAYATLTGGYFNTATQNAATVSGGGTNTASNIFATVSGGAGNVASGQYSAVSGGGTNAASGQFSAISGGGNNTASNIYSAVSGGRNNLASGAYSWAAGYRSSSTASGTFTWNDSEGVELDNNVSDRVRFKARGGFWVTGSTASIIGANLERGVVITGNGRVGIGVQSPAAGIEVAAPGLGDTVYAQVWRDGNGTIVSSVSATGKFYGNGSGLTNLNAVARTGDTMSGPLLIFSGVAQVDDLATTSLRISTGGAIQTSGIGNGTVAGNPRGKGAVDLQTRRSNISYVASGDYSALLAGYDNRASGNYSAVLSGYFNSASGVSAAVGTGVSNSATNSYAFVGGGRDNIASGVSSFIGGGGRDGSGFPAMGNRASQTFSAVVGGAYNIVSGSNSFIGGGLYNVVLGTSSVIAGGENNETRGFYSAVLGGTHNDAWGDHSSLAGGYGNSVDGVGSFIGAGANNNLLQAYGVIGGGMNNDITAVADYGFIGGGYENQAANSHAAVAGGWWNQASGLDSFVGGGWSNLASSDFAVAAGGQDNTASASESVVVGGSTNTASGTAAAVLGGRWNQAGSADSVVVGGLSNMISGTNPKAFIGGGESNQIVGNGQYALVGGGWSNAAYQPYSAILGGQDNTANAVETVVVGGSTNTAGGEASAILGGRANQAGGILAVAVAGATNTANGELSSVVGGTFNVGNSYASFVGGGAFNTVDSENGVIVGGIDNKMLGESRAGFIGGGEMNQSTGTHAVVGGGYMNVSSGAYSAVLGGYQNTAKGMGAAVPGGYWNLAMGDYSFAAGRASSSTAPGTFTWSDSQGVFTDNDVLDQVRFKARGGFLVSGSTNTADPGFFVSGAGRAGVGTTTPQERLQVSGGNIGLDDGTGIVWGIVPAPTISGSDALDFLAFDLAGGPKMRLEGGKAEVYNADIVISTTVGSRGIVFQDKTIQTSAAPRTVLIYKPGDTSITNDAVPNLDPDLQFYVGNDEKWQFEAVLYAFTDDTGFTTDFRAGLSGPPENLLRWDYSFYGADGVSQATGGVLNSYGDRPVDWTAGVIAPGTRLVIRGTIDCGAAGGAFGVTWSQNAAGGFNTTVLAGSYLKAQRVQ